MGGRATRGLTVQVTDEAGKPVEGASVSFRLPDSGPAGTFASGSRTEIVTTGGDGRAGVWGMQWNRTAGIAGSADHGAQRPGARRNDLLGLPFGFSRSASVDGAGRTARDTNGYGSPSRPAARRGRGRGDGAGRQTLRRRFRARRLDFRSAHQALFWGIHENHASCLQPVAGPWTLVAERRNLDTPHDGRTWWTGVRNQIHPPDGPDGAPGRCSESRAASRWAIPLLARGRVGVLGFVLRS